MVLPLLFGKVNVLVQITYPWNGIINAFNSSKSYQDKKDLDRERSDLQKSLENQRQETQLKIAYAQMASQWKIEESRQDYQQKMDAERQQFQLKIAEYKCQESPQLQEFIKSVDVAIAKSNYEFQTWLFNQQKNLQQKLAEYNRQIQLELASCQRETVRQTEEYCKIIENWPMKLVPAQIIDSYEGEVVIPLRVIIAPPEIDYKRFGTANQGFPQIEKRLSQGLRTFLEQYYSTDSNLRPTELLDRAWDSSRFGGGASIKALFWMLKSEPTLVLESEVDGDLINLRLAYWSGGQAIYLYKTVISNLPYRDILDWSAKTRALAWEINVKNKLLALGKTEEEINQKYGGDCAVNLEILKEQKIFQQGGVEVEQNFKINYQDLEKLCQFLTVCHNILTGFFADIHYLIHYNLEPQLPQLLSEVIGDLSEYDVGIYLLQWVADGFLDAFKALEADRLALIPDLSIDLAANLVTLLDKSWGQKVLDYSVASWLAARSFSVGNFEENLAALRAAFTREDLAYVKKLQGCLAALKNKRGSSFGEKEEQPQAREEKKSDRQQDEKPQAREEKKSDRQQEEKPQAREEKKSDRQQDEKLREFHFETITVNAKGKEINRCQGSTRRKIEKLADGVTLEMVYIPGSTFTMGSPKNNKHQESNELPQHQVKILPFYMGKYPVTQAQYQAVMGNNPSTYKGENRPVECVTWHNALEFCQKLSQKTGKTYRLPSEAEWEYACRAGTTTAFHFGETLTPELANYDSNYTYASGPKGVYRQETTDVGSFPPNAFGLCDMHGNVWEWCQDIWHENYNDAPTDGSAWESDGDSSRRVLRGGSWDSSPRVCRSAFRDAIDANHWFFSWGFRVVLVFRL